MRRSVCFYGSSRAVRQPLEVISMLGYAFAVLVSVSLALLIEWSVRSEEGPVPETPARPLSRHELSLYHGGAGSRGLYLAILGQVFDVHQGNKHYGPGGAYHFMAGKDASLAFITGDFTENGLTDDVSSLSPLQVVALYDWLAFYHKEYKAVGTVTGRFYDESGKPTKALLQVRASLAEGQRIKAQSEAEKARYPSCNSEWSAARGQRVWCSSKSGGVIREWAGVPRKLFSPGSSGVRCVCVEDPFSVEDPTLQEYDGCPPHADSCTVIEH